MAKEDKFKDEKKIRKKKSKIKKKKAIKKRYLNKRYTHNENYQILKDNLKEDVEIVTKANCILEKISLNIEKK